MQEARLAGRLQKELKMLQDPPPGVCVWPSNDQSLSRLEARESPLATCPIFLALFPLSI